MRLVDADDFIKKLAIAPLVQEAMRKAFNHMPTVDVVWCKDCIHRIPIVGIPDGYACKKVLREVTLVDFCSWGEMREDDK